MKFTSSNLKPVLYFFVIFLLGFNVGIMVNHTQNCTKTKFNQGLVYGLSLIKNSKLTIIDQNNAIIEIDSLIKIPLKVK